LTPAPSLPPNSYYLYGWGHNYFGQLGNNSYIDTAIITQTTISSPVWYNSAESHGNSNAAIQDDGALWVWGDNSFGNLGTNDIISYSSPVQVSIGGNTWKQCSASIYNLAAIDQYGNLFMSGSNIYGQIGNGNTFSTSQLIQTATFGSWKYATSGYEVTFIIDQNGYLFAAGFNGYGQLGIGNTVNISQFTQVASSFQWLTLDNDSDFTVALRSDNTVWTWGSNSSGQLGQNLNSLLLPQSNTPRQVFTTSDWIHVTAGYSAAYAVKSNGTVWSWGANNSGQLGDGTTINRSSPVQIGFGTDWSTIGAGLQFAVGLKNNGTLYSWGRNDRSQLGNIGLTVNVSSPMQINTGGLTWNVLNVGLSSSSALTVITPFPTQSVTPSPTPTPSETLSPTPSGTQASPTPTPTQAIGNYLYNWGDNSFGQIGNNQSAINYALPVFNAKPGPMWVSSAIAVGMGAGIDTDGNLWTYGGNGYGNLGINRLGGIYSSPVQVINGTNFYRVVVGPTCLGLKKDSTLWSWGDSGYGQVGDGTTISRSVPVQIPGNWIFVANSPYFSAAINSANKLFLWGDNQFGELAQNSTNNESIPVQELTNSNWSYVACGARFAAGIKMDQTLWLWGNNASGMLGQDNIIATSSPVQEITLSNFWIAVACGSDSTAAIKTNGSLWTWGSNNFGQLGDGTITATSSPVQEATNSFNWQSISAGLFHFVGYQAGNQLWAWGNNDSGQLGVNSFTSYSVPVQVFSLGANWLNVTAGGYNSSAIFSGAATPTPSSSASPTPTPTGPTPSPTISPTITPTVTPTPTSTDPTPSPTSSVTPTPTPIPVRLWMYGYNYFGQLGNDNINNSVNVTTTYYPNANWYTGSCSKSFSSFSLKEDSTLWSWGDNAYGQLGLNDIKSRSIPVQIYGGGSWKRISGGVYHTVGIKKDGKLWSWGGNSYGTLGINAGFNDILTVSSPVQECTDSLWLECSAGFDFTLAIKANGTLWAWGSNLYNQLGNGIATNVLPSASSPMIEWYGSNRWKICATTAYSCAAIKTDATIWTWGNGFYGQLALNNNLDFTFPQPIDPPLPPPSWYALSGGFYHLAAIKGSNRSLWLWGANESGQLGDGTIISRSSPVQVLGAGRWSAVACGYNFTAAISEANDLYAWGSNENDALGAIGTTANTSSPALVSALGINWFQVYAGMHHTQVYTFDIGPTPLPSSSPTPTFSPTSTPGASVTPTPTPSITVSPTITPSPTPSASIAPVPPFATVGGQLWLWGDNQYGQLGDQTIINRSSAVQTVSNGSNWRSFSKRYTHSAAVKDDGSLWLWGQNSYGNLGTEDLISRSSPVQTILPSFYWLTPFTGNLFTFVLKQDSSLWCWGANSFGQLGDSTIISKSSPIQFAPSTGIGWINAGGGVNHAAAISRDGTLWCWGNNAYGQLGTNNTISTSSPVQTALGGTNWLEVACGNNFTLGLKKDGTIWGFGKNNYGQYGDYTVETRSFPVLVAIGSIYWTAVTAGSEFAAALTPELVGTPTPTVSPTVSVTPSPTPSGTEATPSPTASATATPTPSGTDATSTPTPTPTQPTPTPTSSPTPTVDPNKESELNIWYRIFSTYTTSLDIHYELGNFITYAYRVETDCRPLVQPLAPFTDDQQACEGRSILTVFARSVQDVCRQVTAAGYITKVNSIQKYTKPVYSLEEEYLISKGLYDPRDKKYVPVPFCEYSACKDLCVNYIMEENAYGDMIYYPTGSDIFGNGTLYIGGTAGVRTGTVIAAGTINVYGEGLIYPGSTIQQTYNYTGSGSIIILGSGTVNYPNFYIMLEQASSIEGAEGIVNQQTVLVEDTTTIPVIGKPNLVTSQVVCQCQNIPLQIRLNTNLYVNSNFINFINRNNLTFNPNLTATFNITTKEFLASYTYTAKSDPNEKWLISININCNNDLDDFDLMPIWTISILFRQYQENKNTLDTMLQVWVPANEFCSASNSFQIGSSYAINVLNATCFANGRTNLPDVFLNDGTGIFRSTAWNNAQILNLSLIPAN
jgi:alpha-tubulin suppressor-like RCC1 family protein